MDFGSTSEKYWLAACVGFTAIIGVELAGDVQLSQHASAAQGAPGATSSNPIHMGADPAIQAVMAPSADMVASIIAQPLFAPGRKPMVHQAEMRRNASPTSGTDNLPPIELAGTLMSDRTDVALIVDPGRMSQRLRVGEAILDWQVIKIDHDQIHLARDGRSQPLALRRGRDDQPSARIRNPMVRPDGRPAGSFEQRR